MRYFDHVVAILMLMLPLLHLHVQFLEHMRGCLGKDCSSTDFGSYLWQRPTAGMPWQAPISTATYGNGEPQGCLSKHCSSTDFGSYLWQRRTAGMPEQASFGHPFGQLPMATANRRDASAWRPSLNLQWSRHSGKIPTPLILPGRKGPSVEFLIVSATFGSN